MGEAISVYNVLVFLLFHHMMKFSHIIYLGWTTRKFFGKICSMLKGENDEIFDKGGHYQLTLSSLGCHLESI